MITNQLAVVLLLTGTAVSATVLACLLFGPRLTRLWRQATPLGRFSFVFAVLCATLFGGTKQNQPLLGSPRRLRSTAPAQPPVTSDDLARGWQLLGPYTNATVCYTMPDGATLATNWWLHGAYEDVVKVGLEGLGGLESLEVWAFSWGKARFRLDDTNEITAVGAPMSAIPFRSRLWSAADSNGSFRITWENFVPGRHHPTTNSQQLTTLSAQLELRQNGDCVTRSNDMETVWRRIDPEDVDGDGYPNDDDSDPFGWTDGADSYYGPRNELPPDCNSNAYYTVTIEVDGPGCHQVAFTGDGYSDYADPSFRAKPGAPYDVKLLIGKTYDVVTDTGIRVIGRSDDEIEVFDVTTNAFSVVWPVSISEAPVLFAAPSPGLFGIPRTPSIFSLSVIPNWLGGLLSWQTNLCCQIVDCGGWYRFACQDDCMCGGCLFDGFYTYEGYSLWFGNIHCGCHYEPDNVTTIGLSAPTVVFKNGALRPLHVSFHQGDRNEQEEGTLTLEITRGADKIRLWSDNRKSREETQPSWDVSTFSGRTLYLEGVGTSTNTCDIVFQLVWTKSNGSAVQTNATTTCAEVLQTIVTTTSPDILDGSSNQQPFAGHANWNFDVTHSPSPDKHFSVLFRDVSDDDFSVHDFSVDMTLVVQPTGAPVGTARWFSLAPTPASGLVSSTGALTGELRNPKVGGVYHLGSCFDGSPTNECNIVLPLAGAEMSDVLAGDLLEADGFVSRSKSTFPRRWYTRALFASRWFTWDTYGYYRGRPDNRDHPTVYCYNQVSDKSGKGAIGTLLGIPIHVEKLSNLLAGYACEKLEVPIEEQGLAQWYGTSNDESAELSWTIGTRLANGGDFMQEIGYLTTNAYRYASEKCRRLWPNPEPADNHRGFFGHGNFNTEFSSPGFIYSNR